MNTSTDISNEKMKQRLKRTTNPSGDYVGELLRILAGSEMKLTGVERSELVNCVIKYVVSLLCVLFTAAAIYFASVDPKALTNRYFTYIALTIIPIVVGSVLITPIVKAGTSIMTTTFYIIIIVASILVVHYLIRYIVAANTVVANYIIVVFVGLTVISGLAIGYRVFYKALKNVTGWKGFAIKLLFYLPCLLLDFVNYMIEDYNKTPRIVGVVFIIQVLVLCLYFIIPLIMNYFSAFNETTNRVELVKNPLFLTREYEIADNEILRKPEYILSPSYARYDPLNPTGATREEDTTTIKDNDEKLNYKKYSSSNWENQNKDLTPPASSAPMADEYSKSYSISMWIFVNEGVDIRKEEITIFKYGNNVEGNDRGKPHIVYNANNGLEGDKYSIYYSDNYLANVSRYSFDMPAQKWNNVVVTYENSRADLFVNGELINSFIFEEKSTGAGGGSPLPMYSKFDTIRVGYGHPNEKTRGVNGAICNVVYYRTPLKDYEVQNKYMLLYDKTPPI